MSETQSNAAARACNWTVRDTPVGPLLLAATDEGLVNVVFHAEGRTLDQALSRLTGRLGAAPVRTDDPARTENPVRIKGPVRAHAAPSPNSGSGSASVAPAAPQPVLAQACAEIDAYIGGGLRGGFTVSLDWSLSRGFNERVLRELAASVPYGTTAGYQDLAGRVGEPGAARAVGVAMGSNPLPVVVACHRVVESGGGLGGFGGGRETKRALLALEGLLPQPLF